MVDRTKEIKVLANITSAIFAIAAIAGMVILRLFREYLNIFIFVFLITVLVLAIVMIKLIRTASYKVLHLITQPTDHYKAFIGEITPNYTMIRSSYPNGV